MYCMYIQFQMQVLDATCPGGRHNVVRHRLKPQGTSPTPEFWHSCCVVTCKFPSYNVKRVSLSISRFGSDPYFLCQPKKKIGKQLQTTSQLIDLR